jgi:hypothetical protein
VTGDRIYTGRYPRDKELDRLLEQVHIVDAAIGAKPNPVTVRGFLALAGEPDKQRSEETVRGVGMVGVEVLGDKLLGMDSELGPGRVQEIADILRAAFPPAATTDQVDLQPVVEPGQKVKPNQLFERLNRYFYLHTWRKGGLHRLYLKASSGDDLGWKDVNTQEIQISCEGDDAKLARAILESATPVSVTLSAEALPRLPINVPGGKLVGWLTKVRLSVFVGQEWNKGATHRLYGTYIDPLNGTFSLGYADLKTGKLHPSVTGNLSKDLGSAEKYLQLVVDRRPVR